MEKPYRNQTTKVHGYQMEQYELYDVGRGVIEKFDQ
jgi:hypothetical protein